MLKLVHAADLHLDSPLGGLERYPGAPVEQARGATRRAFRNLVDLCLAERAAVLVIAGDVFDGDWKDYATGLFFVGELTRLREGGVRVAIVRGNHDAMSQITRHLRLPDNVIEFSADAAETHTLEDVGVALHGQSFKTRAVTADLSLGYPEPVLGLFNVGVLHTSVNGRPGHEPYAPCSLEALIAKEYEYWALGHVHTREVLAREPFVVFPGNLQGRHAREVGAKGATLVTVEEGRVVKLEHRTLDAVRWAHLHVDAGGVDAIDDVLDAVRERLGAALEEAGGRTLLCRVTVEGQTAAHAALHADRDRLQNEVRAFGAELGADALWIEKVRAETTPPDRERGSSALGTRDDALAQLVRTLEELRETPEGLQRFTDGLQALRSRLPPELRDGPQALPIDSVEFLASLLDDVEQLLLPRLMTGSEEP